MNYDKMTNEEINLAVANLLPDEIFCNDKGVPVRLEPNEAPAYTGIDFDEIPFDPCNSWADAGSIIEKNKINLVVDQNVWIAVSERRAIKHENPLRAAMVIFLMIKGG